jgi:hypothetical protein
VIRALGQLLNGVFFACGHLGLLRLLLLLLLMRSLELQKRHPLQYTYFMDAQINFMDA